MEALGTKPACWSQCAAACLPGYILWLRSVLNNLLPAALHMHDIAATCLNLTSSPSCSKHMQDCLPCILGMPLHVWIWPCAVWRLKPKEAASYVNFKDKPGTITNKLAIAAKSMQRAQSRENLAGLREDKGAGPAPTRPPSRRLAGQDPVGELAVCFFALLLPRFVHRSADRHPVLR